MVVGKDMENLQVYGIIDLTPHVGKFQTAASAMLGTVNWSETMAAVKFTFESLISYRVNVPTNMVLIDVSVNVPGIRTQFLSPYSELSEFVTEMLTPKFIRECTSAYPTWGPTNLHKPA